MTAGLPRSVRSVASILCARPASLFIGPSSHRRRRTICSFSGPTDYVRQPGDLGSFGESSMASRRKRGPAALRRWVSPALPLSDVAFIYAARGKRVNSGSYLSGPGPDRGGRNASGRFASFSITRAGTGSTATTSRLRCGAERTSAIALSKSRMSSESLRHVSSTAMRFCASSSAFAAVV